MKKGIKLVCSAIVFAFMLSSCYISKESEQPKTISVSGSGVVSVNPDTATVDFTVVTTGWSAKQIVTDNDTLSNKLSEAVKAVGVNAADITLSDCNVSNPGSQYEARRNVRVVVRNVSLVPAVVDCKSGTNMRVIKVEYSLNDTVSVMRRARTAAIQQAQDAASLLAGASGSKIGEVAAISEEKAESKIGPDGKINVTSDVKVTYTLQ